MKSLHLSFVLFFLSISLSFSQDYETHLSKIEASKKEFKLAYDKSTNKDSVLKKAGYFIEKELTINLFNHWKGTKWDFNGYTNTPKTGTIACGYYVSTNLKHLGFNINRYKMAQQSALNEVKTIDPNPKTFYGNSEDFLKQFKDNADDGLYIIGMSSHVGMIQKTKDQIYFLHSSPIETIGVINEIANESAVLSWSNVFITGKISHNNSLIKKWLNNEQINVKLD